MRHGDDAVREDDARFEHVHADAADGVVEVEQIAVLIWNLRGGSQVVSMLTATLHHAISLLIFFASKLYRHQWL